MTTQEMVDLVRDRSKQPDTAKILRELRAAFRWAVARIYTTEGGPDLLSTIGTELTITGTTRDYNLAANVQGTFLGLKQLWLKLPGDTNFTPLNEADLTAPSFQDRDSKPTADPDIAFGHPVLYQVYNFGMLRFGPALPDTSVLRADFFKFGPAPDPTTNNSPTSGTDLTDLFHDGIVCKASAHCLENLDDDRVGGWETRARDYLNDALFAAQKRVQGPEAHQGWARRRRRFFV
jgi:hypothetical protein